jgi:ribosome-associated translation inhibitor RaiA
VQVPLKITFRNVPKTSDIERLINKQAAKLERVCNYIVSCRLVVEKPQQHQKSGNPFRVRLDITVPPEHELVVIRESSEGELHERLPTVLRRAFDAMRRQVERLTQKQRKEVKSHPEQEAAGFVNRLFRKGMDLSKPWKVVRFIFIEIACWEGNLTAWRSELACIGQKSKGRRDPRRPPFGLSISLVLGTQA